LLLGPLKMLCFFRLHFRDCCVQHIENLCIIGLTGDLTEQLPIRVIVSLGAKMFSIALISAALPVSPLVIVLSRASAFFLGRYLRSRINVGSIHAELPDDSGRDRFMLSRLLPK
jgi:hypothetical protein